MTHTPQTPALREFWIRQGVEFETDQTFDQIINEETSRMLFGGDPFWKKEYVHVIEHSAYAAAAVKIADLEKLLADIKSCKVGEFVVYHPTIDPDADVVFERFKVLESCLEVATSALRSTVGYEPFGHGSLMPYRCSEALKEISAKLGE
jgi:hypothetical protein